MVLFFFKKEEEESMDFQISRVQMRFEAILNFGPKRAHLYYFWSYGNLAIMKSHNLTEQQAHSNVPPQ